jgi:hypothetical protein
LGKEVTRILQRIDISRTLLKTMVVSGNFHRTVLTGQPSSDLWQNRTSAGNFSPLVIDNKSTLPLQVTAALIFPC